MTGVEFAVKSEIREHEGLELLRAITPLLKRANQERKLRGQDEISLS